MGALGVFVFLFSHMLTLCPHFGVYSWHSTALCRVVYRLTLFWVNVLSTSPKTCPMPKNSSAATKSSRRNCKKGIRKRLLWKISKANYPSKFGFSRKHSWYGRSIVSCEHSAQCHILSVQDTKEADESGDEKDFMHSDEGLSHWLLVAVADFRLMCPNM